MINRLNKQLSEYPENAVTFHTDWIDEMVEHDGRNQKRRQQLASVSFRAPAQILEEVATLIEYSGGTRSQMLCQLLRDGLALKSMMAVKDFVMCQFETLEIDRTNDHALMHMLSGKVDQLTRLIEANFAAQADPKAK